MKLILKNTWMFAPNFMVIHPNSLFVTEVAMVNIMVALKEKSGDHQSCCDSSSGDKKRLYKTISVWTKVLANKNIFSHIVFWVSRTLPQKEGFVCLKKVSPVSHTIRSARPICIITVLLLTRCRISICCCSQVFIELYNIRRLQWMEAFMCRHYTCCVCVLPPGLQICRTGFCGGGSALGGPNSSSNVS